MLQSSSIVILQKFLPSLKALASTLKRSWVYSLYLCSPDNYRIVNNTEEEGHVAVPVDCPEQLGLAGFAPHPNVTPAFILSVTKPKRDPHDDVRPDVNLAVRVVNVWSRVVNFSNQVPGLCAGQWEISSLKFVFLKEIYLNNLHSPFENPQKITLSSETTLVILSVSPLARLRVRTDTGWKSLHNFLHYCEFNERQSDVKILQLT